MTIDGRGNIYVNSIGFDFAEMSERVGDPSKPPTGVIALITPDGTAILRNAKLTPNPRRSERISRSNVLLVPARGGSVRLDRSTMAFGFATSN